jgi:hypothetical protein
MTRGKVFITKTRTHYRDLNPGPLVSKSRPETTRPAGYLTLYHQSKIHKIKYSMNTVLYRWYLWSPMKVGVCYYKAGNLTRSLK